jgi:hypothetical protein
VKKWGWKKVAPNVGQSAWGGGGGGKKEIARQKSAKKLAWVKNINVKHQNVVKNGAR